MGIWNNIKNNIREEIDDREFNIWISPIKYIGTVDNEIFLKIPDDEFLKSLKENYLELINSCLYKYSSDLSIQFILSEKPDISYKKRKKKKIRRKISNVNPKYTLDNFVVGPKNQFAHAIALGAARGDTSYNPIYIYGQVGLGKTHILNGIANYILRNDQNRSVIYKTSRKFLDEMVYHLQNQKYSKFKQKYQNIDCLIIDDIQLISTWETTKKELFFIFNERYESTKQIIISSDCPPKEIKNLEDRLRSRFEWGIIAQIEPPNIETRIAILKQKAKEKNISINNEITEFIASKIKGNVRRLEGALIRIKALSSIKGIPINLTLAKEGIKYYVDDDSQEITPERIKNFIAKKFGIKPKQLNSKNNSPKIAFPRQISMFLLKNLTDMTISNIGKKFGNKHHSTVIHSIRKIEKKMKEDALFEEKINTYLRRFKHE